MILSKIIEEIFKIILFNVLFLSSSRRNIGGQAVIEGVMMKGPSLWSVAVRGGNGRIHLKREQLKPLPSVFKLPVIRGVVALFQAIGLGIKAINFSASKAFEEKDGDAMSPVAIFVTVVLAFLIGITFFIFLPLYLTKLMGTFVPIIKESSISFNLVDGMIRVGVFLLYIFTIGLWKEMRRVYEYHGAEHKVIHAYEKGDDLAVKSIVREYSPQHPRCGTSFLLIVMVVSIFIFSLVPHDWNFIMKFLSRMVLIPLIAGVSYEMLKLSARRRHIGFFKILIKPGLFLQRLTTREPDESQIEVALYALREVVEGRSA